MVGDTHDVEDGHHYQQFPQSSQRRGTGPPTKIEDQSCPHIGRISEQVEEIPLQEHPELAKPRALKDCARLLVHLRLCPKHA